MEQGGAYHGEDRRLASAARTTMSRAELVAAAAIVAAAWLAGMLLPPGNGLPLPAAAAALGVAVGTLCVARWLIAGEAPALLLGAAALLHAVALVGVAELTPLSTDWLVPAAMLAVLGLLLAATVVRRVDTRVRPATVAAGALGLFALGAALPVTGVFTAFLAALAVAYGVRGWRRGHWLFASYALLLAALAIAAVTPSPWIVRLAGLGLALRGALRQLLVDYRDQSASLLSTRVSLATAEDRIRATRLRAEEQAHEARSALAAIEGASSTLERYRDRLPSQTRAQLLDGVKGEIRRLQRLVDPTTEPTIPFAMADLLTPIVAAERARGTTVEERVAADLRALGRPEATGDVVRALLDNARRYAPGPVTIRAWGHGDRIQLRIEDRGPGVAHSERESIFGRGVRGVAGNGVAGSGLGLAIAAELARDQDGRLWVEDREGGGASFALELPAASAVLADDLQHRVERVEGHLPALPVDRHGARARAGTGRQPHDHPRADPARG